MHTAKHYDFLESPEIVAGERDGLSPREHQALVYAANGFNGDLTAQEMGVKPGTVYKFLESVQIKLNALNKYHAVSIAFCRGIIKQEGYVSSPAALVYSFIVGIALSCSISVIDAEYGRPRPARPMRTVRVARGGRRE